jgi:hypothetical protein
MGGGVVSEDSKPPSDSHLKRGRGTEWWTRPQLKNICQYSFYDNKDLPVPLRLTFEARERAKS